MEVNQFVLMVAAFMIVATVMLSTSDLRDAPAPLPSLHYVCSFDQFCRDRDCAQPLPAEFIIVAQQPATSDDAYFQRAGDRPDHIGLQSTGALEWVAQVGKSGGLHLKLQENGAMIYEEKTGLNPDSAVLAHGTGVCRDMRAEQGEQG
ncbi:hypothetical protein [Pseudorhodobacter sp.]|uniref:hypothetical protein n=1 Tax=Pseudorhodobacter sp. TaxID=1934400 RepID=UPI0026493F52|nr:hypothetical protein [Pseudorhodobacter sp.]MDN5787273.1 hypothetical protein [Pseudorhodobacter sp.]